MISRKGFPLNNPMKQEEIEKIVNTIVSDLEGNRNIDEIPVENPDKAEIHELIEILFRIAYPGYFRDRACKVSNSRNGYALTIEDAFYRMREQVFRALNLRRENKLGEEERERESYRICKVFFERIPHIREYLETDLLATYDGDPAAGCYAEIILAYPGIFAITVYRLAHELYLEQVPVLPRLMTEYAHSLTGIDIHPGATIGKYFFIDHGTGVVIGETTVIGEHVKLYQGVTLGAKSFPLGEDGNPVKGIDRHPKIGNNVVIYSGATILGGDTHIGDNSTIGGNVWLTHSVPANSTILRN